MKKNLFAVLVLVFIGTVAQARVGGTGPPDSTETEIAVDSAVGSLPAESTSLPKNDKIADIEKLLTLTRAIELGLQAMGEMVNSLRQNLPDVPDEFWLDFADKIRTEDLVEMLVPVYDRHLTHREVLELIEFFQGAVGQKLVAVQPEIVKESMRAGQAWGEKIGREVVAELQKKGYLQAQEH